jgi:hypothetical protein
VDTYKNKWLQNVFPKSFSTILFQLGSVILRENLLFPDERIAMIRKYFDAAWMAFFGDEISEQELIVPTNADIFEYLRFENLPNIITDLYPDFDCIINHKNNGERAIKNIEFVDEKQKQKANDSALALVIMIGTLLPHSRYPDTKVMALEMLTAIGKQIREEFRLQYIVPYAMSCFNDPMCKVRLAAIDCVIDVLKDADSIEIGHTDYYIFDTYLFPAFLKLIDDSEKIIQLKFIEILPDLVNIGKMLITSVNMHKQKITILAKDEQFEVEIDQEQREELLFANLLMESYVEGFNSQYKMRILSTIHEDEDEAEGEGDNQTTSETNAETNTETNTETNAETNEESKNLSDSDDEETIITTKREMIRQIEMDLKVTKLAQSVYDESVLPIAWSRKRFVTDEQSRSVASIGYNMDLDIIDFDITDDPEQEDEIEKEIEILKEKILEVVDKIIVEQDTQKDYVLMNNIEDIAEFLGEQINSERLLPYILSFPNLKDDMLTYATLKGLRVFSHHVVGLEELKYILTSCDNLIYDLNEIVVLEAIKTVHYFAIKHEQVFENIEK